MSVIGLPKQEICGIPPVFISFQVYFHCSTCGNKHHILYILCFCFAAEMLFYLLLLMFGNLHCSCRQAGSLYIFPDLPMHFSVFVYTALLSIISVHITGYSVPSGPEGRLWCACFFSLFIHIIRGFRLCFSHFYRQFNSL